MTAIELAAIASAAVPGLNVTAFGPEPDDAADFSSALLVDSENRRWRVRSPKHAEASARLETERQVLRAFSPAIRAELPFLLPTVAGTVRQGELNTFVYSHISGKPESVEELAAGGSALALEIGATIAAIHDLPQELVTRADLPSYTANEFRQRKLNELDQAATTGKIPPSLLLRWEHALEDVALWRFNASVVHGDLHEDNILVEGTRVTAVMGWTDLRVGDPADDFAWLVAINDPPFVDTVMQAYAAARHETPDPHLLRRAALSAEFALAQWLVKGVAADSARMVSDAQDMLATLKADVDAHGGQRISTDPAPVAEAAVAKADGAKAADVTSNVAAADEVATGAIPVVGRTAVETTAVESPEEHAPAVKKSVATAASEPSKTRDPGKSASDVVPADTTAEAKPRNVEGKTDDDGAPAVGPENAEPDNGEPSRVEPGNGESDTVKPDDAESDNDTIARSHEDEAPGSAEDLDTTALKVIPMKTPPSN